MKKLRDQTLQFCGIISQSQRVQRKTINVRQFSLLFSFFLVMLTTIISESYKFFEKQLALFLKTRTALEHLVFAIWKSSLERSPLHMEESSLLSNYGRLCSRVKTSLFFEVQQKILALLLSQRKLHLRIALFFPTSQGLMVLPFHILFPTGKTYQIRILDPIVHPTAL